MKPSPGNTARLASEAELLGLSLGPTAVALLTDYVFKDPAMIDWSVSCVVIASYVFRHHVTALPPTLRRGRAGNGKLDRRTLIQYQWQP